MVIEIVHFRPIGKVVSPVKHPVDEKWGGVVSEIHLRKDLAAGLSGLEGFSHVQVVYFMQESNWNPSSDLVRRPQGKPDMPLTGIFAQRARNRPNAVGITAVAIVSVHDNVLQVKGLDAIDGTPVLDVKPYYPAYDRADGAVVPEWVGKLMKNYFSSGVPGGGEKAVTVIDAPALVQAAGNMPKTVEEFFGMAGSKTARISIARMKSPAGWSEPGQTPGFDEYSIILQGMLKITARDQIVELHAGQAALCRRGEWVQYSTPGPEGAEYVSVCLPAFSPELVNRDEPGK